MFSIRSPNAATFAFTFRSIIHHQDSGRTFNSRKISVLWIHAAEIHQDCLPAPFSRRQQRHLTEQLGRIREQQSINLSKHVSILGLQTVVDVFTKGY